MEDGLFSKDKWHLLDVSGGGCLKRNFTKDSLPYDIDHVNKTLSLPLEAFEEFEDTVRVDYHVLALEAIGGTMRNPQIAGNAPELLLHHSFVDKLWNQWQNKEMNTKMSTSKRALQTLWIKVLWPGMD